MASPSRRLAMSSSAASPSPPTLTARPARSPRAPGRLRRRLAPGTPPPPPGSGPGTPPGSGGGPGGSGSGEGAEPGVGIPYVYADILGRPQFHPNRATRVPIVFGNTGGRAGYGVPLWIDGIERRDWSVDVELEKVTGAGPVVVSDATAAVRHGNKLLLPLVLPAIPADSTGTIQLTITTANRYTLRAWADPPLVPVPAAGARARAAQDGTTAIPQALEDCFSGVLNYAFDKAVGDLIPDACVKYVADKVLKRVGFEADKFFDDLLGADGTWTPRVVTGGRRHRRAPGGQAVRQQLRRDRSVIDQHRVRDRPHADRDVEGARGPAGHRGQREARGRLHEGVDRRRRRDP